MAIFKNTDPRSLGYENRNEPLEKIIESFGYTKYAGDSFNNDKTYIIYNKYQVSSWDRSKRGFLNSEYKGFSIMEHYYDGWNAKHTTKYGEPSKSYTAYIDINGLTYVYLNDVSSIVTPEELKAFAEGDMTGSNEESIATKIRRMYFDHIADEFGI